MRLTPNFRPAALLTVTMLAAGAATLPTPAQAQVTLRGGSVAGTAAGDPVAGEITRVGPEGVVVAVGSTSKTIGWDRIREVRGEQAAAAAKQLEAVGELWRARTRLERGDFAAAEPMLDAMAARERGLFGPTSAVVFEGQLRCRLKRGAIAPAIWAWLDWAKARGGAIGAGSDLALNWIGGRVDGPPVLEPRTGLIFGTPPIFLHDAALDAAVASDEWARFVVPGNAPAGGMNDKSTGDATIAELAMLYRAAMRYEAELPPELAAVTSQSDAVRLVADMVQARAGNDGQREAARANLKSRLEQRDIDPWMECWCRVAMGRSLIREADSDMMRAGVIQLLHVPSRFSRVSSYASAIALAESAVMLHDLGDEQGAAALKGELMDRYARTTAAGWPRLREIRALPDPGKPISAPSAPSASSTKPTPAPAGRGG